MTSLLYLMQSSALCYWEPRGHAEPFDFVKTGGGGPSTTAYGAKGIPNE